FYGCTGLVTLPDDVLIASVLNWTTLVTDELIAAVTAAAINAGNEINTEEGHVFDCREMYTTDGRTFGEWGVKDDAIRIRAYNTQSPIIPLNQSYSSVVKRDYGIHASHLEFGEVRRVDRVTNGEWDFDTSTSTGHGTRPVTNTNIDASQGIDCGYIPYTLLEITTVSRGPNSNTASPNLVDSTNTPIDTSTWNEGLKGIQFTRSSGDHILPMIDNPVVHFGSSQSNWTTEVTVSAAREVDPFLIPSGATASNVILPVGERATIWLGDYPIEAESKTGTDPRQELSWLTADAGDDFPQSMAKANILQRHNNKEFDGLRSLGSVFSEPIVYFRGGKSSKDHSVPLFFGGGFSGVTLDVNDGTTNDYSSFYTHPYANGPTGVSGLQNANEISTSYAMLDGNAMFAFFPGAALCNQHRGSITPPAFNQQNILAPDLSKGGVTYSAGEIKAKPVPLVMRFAHPTARYEDHVDTSVENKTTYLIFGPGQAFPFTQEVADADSGNAANTKEPFPGRVIVSGSTWASIPLDESIANSRHVFPNHIVNEKYNFMPPSKVYYDATAGFHWRAMVNWESPAGYCWKGKFSQRPEHGRHYGQQFNDSTPHDVTGTAQIGYDLTHIHPKMHTPTIGFGITMAADTVWHMDGGFHPGGSWLDNQITFNPPHAGKSAARVLSSNWERANQIHPT
ncbi:hypothetical protein N9246_01780, partial [bacterium]|nr:hypothetical protein [bacterium]